MFFSPLMSCDKSIDSLSKFPVAVGYRIAGIVRAQFKSDLVPRVGPWRVVIHLLSTDGDPGHNSERFAEVLEGETLCQVVVNSVPAHIRYCFKDSKVAFKKV